MNKTKKQIEEAIYAAIYSVTEDIARTCDATEIESYAASVRVLAEAYDIVHRGKKGGF